MGHTEGDFFAGGALDVGEVDKDALSGLGPEIQLIFRVLGDALEGFEHQVKGADVGEVVFAAFRAADIVLVDIRLHFLKAPAGGQSARVLDKLIGTVAGFAAFAVHEGVGEVAYVAGGDPHLGIHQDGGIQAHIVGAFLDEFLPPGALDVIFQLHAQGAVIPGIGQSAIYVGAGENKAPSLAQSDDFFHGFFRVLHG